MIITRKCPFSGKVNTMDIPITEDQLTAYHAGGQCIQYVFPQLTDDQREFIMTGITAEKWNDIFKNDPEDEGE